MKSAETMWIISKRRPLWLAPLRKRRITISAKKLTVPTAALSFLSRSSRITICGRSMTCIARRITSFPWNSSRKSLKSMRLGNGRFLCSLDGGSKPSRGTRMATCPQNNTPTSLCASIMTPRFIPNCWKPIKEA